MEYFYTPPHLIERQTLTIEGNEFSHLTHVMRKKVGDEVRVVDGKGNAYDAVISEISKRTARCAIHTHHSRLNEPDLDVTLAAGVLKNSSRFDFLVEKSTELSVNTIVPLITERTIPQRRRTERWKNLTLAAMKQSGRCVLPTVHELTSFEDFIAAPKPDSLKLIPHERAEKPTISDLLRNQKNTSIILCIGPEGGFSDNEIEAAVKNGFAPVSLGTRRLRAETAAIVAVATILV
jgi:16S rRNA (uracil1498-N3)-methyltransferase